ncbi:hypothetical protein LSAT2_015300, partial [Lamellibrachia satsuma]
GGRRRSVSYSRTGRTTTVCVVFKDRKDDADQFRHDMLPFVKMLQECANIVARVCPVLVQFVSSSDACPPSFRGGHIAQVGHYCSPPYRGFYGDVTRIIT